MLLFDVDLSEGKDRSRLVALVRMIELYPAKADLFVTFLPELDN